MPTLGARVSASSSSERCFAGTAPGRWSAGPAPQWELTSDCEPLRRYVWVDPSRCAKRVSSTVPNAGPSNLPSCVQRDDGMLASDVGNVSILMLGDSTSAQLLWHTCEAFRVKPASLVQINASHGPLKKYTHRLRSLDNHVCKMSTADEAARFVLGSFSHYGVTGPPYWVFAYPIPPWLSDTSVGMVRDNIPRIKKHTPRNGDPTVIIASSGFWDIASWWAHEGNFSKSWSVPADSAADATAPGAAKGGSGRNHTALYLHGVHRFVREIVARFNKAVRAAAPGWRLPLLDAEAMLKSLSKTANAGLGKGPVYGTLDGRHLHPWLNMALLNLMLNLAHSVAKQQRQGDAAARDQKAAAS